MKTIVSRRMRQYDEGQWKDLIEEYERDIIIAQGMHHEEQSDEKKELDDLKKFAEDFNQVVRAFKARSAG